MYITVVWCQGVIPRTQSCRPAANMEQVQLHNWGQSSHCPVGKTTVWLLVSVAALYWSTSPLLIMVQDSPSFMNRDASKQTKFFYLLCWKRGPRFTVALKAHWAGNKDLIPFLQISSPGFPFLTLDTWFICSISLSSWKLNLDAGDKMVDRIEKNPRLSQSLCAQSEGML